MAKNGGDEVPPLDRNSFPFTPDRLTRACRAAMEAGLRKTWRDEGCKQLVIRVGARGGVFYRYGRTQGKAAPVYEWIGDFSGVNAVPLETARTRCNELRFDPNAHVAQKRRRLRSGGPTIGVAWAEYINAATTGLFAMGRNRGPLRKSTVKSYEDLYNPYLKPHAEKSLHWLADNIKELFETVGTRGLLPVESPRKSPATANKLLQVVKNLFEYCREKEYWELPNPTSDPKTAKPFKKFAIPRREVFLSEDQSRRLFAAMEAKGDYWMDFFAIALLTGRRLDNVRKLRWEAIDLERGTIVALANEMKNGQPHVAELSKECLEVLCRRNKKADVDDEWVFPGRKRGQPIVNPDHAWDDIRTNAGLPTFRIHDLRHTAGTWAHQAGVSHTGIQKYLAHKSQTTTLLYLHASDREKKQAADAVGARFSQLQKKKRPRKQK